ESGLDETLSLFCSDSKIDEITARMISIHYHAMRTSRYAGEDSRSTTPAEYAEARNSALGAVRATFYDSYNLLNHLNGSHNPHIAYKQLRGARGSLKTEPEKIFVVHSETTVQISFEEFVTLFKGLTESLNVNTVKAHLGKAVNYLNSQFHKWQEVKSDTTKFLKGRAQRQEIIDYETRMLRFNQAEDDMRRNLTTIIGINPRIKFIPNPDQQQNS
ncbi:MAG TPA: hypothetical protein VGA67_01975, partial [Candidatus Dojkabacteria bacterium]